jgi:AraC-like DNA-binding protein
MSERTLNRHFQQQTTLTWSEWVRRAKLMEALVRLAQGHSVLRVALDLGYGSHSAFSAMFRRVMGVAPSDYFRRRPDGCADRIAQRLKRGARHVAIDAHAPAAVCHSGKRSEYRPPSGCRCVRRGYAHDNP